MRLRLAKIVQTQSYSGRQNVEEKKAENCILHYELANIHLHM
jgi:hypothetical protein